MLISNVMFEELTTSTAKAAKRLLGCELHRKIGNELLRVKIVEIEAYDQNDPASHTFNGLTARNRAMFGPAGFSYIYFIYGLHFCFNIVTGKEGYGQGALIRAVEPIEGFEYIQKIRNMKGPNTTNGPGKLCSALEINMSLYGHDLSKTPLKLEMVDPLKKSDVIQTTRIGLKKAVDTPWRFYIKDNKYVSKF